MALAGGADFAELARTRAKDPAGGDLGWLARGELDAAFERPLLELKKGQATAPIRSGSAYHLLKLDDREELTADRLADARQQVRDLLLPEEGARAVRRVAGRPPATSADCDPAVRTTALPQGPVGLAVLLPPVL